jgi:4-coumarate--CoA ligase
MSNIYHSPFPPVTVPTNLSISQFLQLYNPDDVPNEKTILEDFDQPENILSYGDVRSKSARCAHALRTRRGLQVGDTVAIYAQNSVNWVLLAHSVMFAGACFRYAKLRMRSESSIDPVIARLTRRPQNSS